jgi:hypothetical protein
MTIQELAAQVAALAKVQIETLQLIGNQSERHGQEMSEFRQRHDQEMSELRHAQIATERSLARLSETVDRFIARGSNGHQQ